jgi:hypothetical protein
MQGLRSHEESGVFLYAAMKNDEHNSADGRFRAADK